MVRDRVLMFGMKSEEEDLSANSLHDPGSRCKFCLHQLELGEFRGMIVNVVVVFLVHEASCLHQNPSTCM